MLYTDAFPGMITGSRQVFELALQGKARSILMINITVLGVLFGLSNLFGSLSQNLDLPMHGKYALITPFFFSAYGIFTMLAALAGFCMIYWAAAKAFGGPGGLGLVLDLIGLAALPFWLLAPLLNFTLNFRQEERIPLYLLIPIVLIFIWSFKLVRQSLMVGQNLSEGRATLAVACMWIFSISAIYVFIP